MSKYTQLQEAYHKQQLVDIVMRATQDIYTGNIIQVSEKHVLLRVYNDYGLQNGYVLVMIKAIAVISIAGSDLKRIKQRIQLAKKYHLYQAKALIMPLFANKNLLLEVLQYLQQQQVVVLIIGATKFQYQQAKVKDVQAAKVTITTFDFFDFAYNGQTQRFLSNQIDALEFGGQELNQATRFFQQPRTHKIPIIIKSNLHLAPFFKALTQQDTLLMVYINNSNHNFYVGQIIGTTDQEILLSLVDQDGYFGGYTLIKLSEISYVSIQTDYLRMIATYRLWHQQDHTFIQPVLNNQLKVTDHNLWAQVFQQIMSQKLIIRIQLQQSNTEFLASVIECNDTEVKLAIFDDFAVSDNVKVREFKYTELARITFGYLNSFFTKTELIN